MNICKSWLLSATCTVVILMVATYATSTEAAKQKQAEVNLQQQVAAAPSSTTLKYGDKTTKKIQNKEMQQHIPTSPTVGKTKTVANVKLQVDKQHNTANRVLSRVERTELPTHQPNIQITQRYDGRSPQNQLAEPHEIPIVHKSSELLNKPITPTVGQQQQQQGRRENSNRSRSSNTRTQLRQPPRQNHNLNNQTERNIEKTKAPATTRTAIATAHTSNNSRKRKPTTSNIINNNQPPLSSRNANNVSHQHHQRSSQNNNNNDYKNNSSKSQTLLASSNTSAASGRQSKIENSSYRQRALRPPFQLPNSFNIFTPEFWQFLNPNSSPVTTTTTSTTTRKPPKKYKPPTQVTTKEEKLSLVKPKQTIPSRTTTNKPQPVQKDIIAKNVTKKDDGPFRIALPTFNVLSSKRETNDEGEIGKRNVDKGTNLRERFDCPRESEVRFQLFPKICKIDEDCKVWNREEICCEIFGAKSCVSGIPKPLEETSHAPLLGVIPRKCPDRPLAELWWEVKECETDMDCWPRVCCPDGRRRYCRTSQPELNTVPVPVQRSFNYLSEYLECTAPPPPIFDLHPKACTSTLDCFPNVCCQEAGLRHCRPPKKSVLTMLANVFNVDFVKRLTQNIVIK